MNTRSEQHAQLRLAAFDEFMREFRRTYWNFYSNPARTNEERARMDESVRLVFYAAFDAGVDSKAVTSLFARSNT